MLKRVSAMQARRQLGQIMNEVSIKEDSYIIERAGKPLVAIIPMREYERLQKDKEKFFQMVTELRDQVKDIGSQEIDKTIDEAIDEAKKAELSAEPSTVDA